MYFSWIKDWHTNKQASGPSLTDQKEGNIGKGTWVHLQVYILPFLYLAQCQKYLQII